MMKVDLKAAVSVFRGLDQELLQPADFQSCYYLTFCCMYGAECEVVITTPKIYWLEEFSVYSRENIDSGLDIDSSYLTRKEEF